MRSPDYMMKRVAYFGVISVLAIGFWVFLPSRMQPKKARPSLAAPKLSSSGIPLSASRTQDFQPDTASGFHLLVPLKKRDIAAARIGDRIDSFESKGENHSLDLQLADNQNPTRQPFDTQRIQTASVTLIDQGTPDAASPIFAGDRDSSLEHASDVTLVKDEKKVGDLTDQLSMQSFDHFYSVLFDPQTDFAAGMKEAGTPARETANSTGSASGTDRNPFTDAINNLKKDPLPGATTSPTSPASTASQPASQNSGSQSNGNAEPTAKNPSQTVSPTIQNPPPRDPTPQVNIPGAARPFTIVGDITESGIGGIYPGLRLQANQFEIPHLGLVNLKLSVIADPAYSMRTVLVDDLNGDDIADLVLAGETETSIMVWLGLPNGDFIYAGGSPIPVSGRSLAVADFNADGIPDIAILQGSNSKYIDILRGTGDGRFQYVESTQLLGEVDMLVATDLDDNGRLDLFGTNLSTFRSWILMSGDSPLTFLKSAFTFTNLPTAQVLQDINLDSRLEQLFLFQNRMKLSVVLNPPRSLIIRHIATVNLRYPMLLVLGDILGEGFTDIGIARLKH